MQQAKLGVSLHPPDHLDDGVAFHQAVGVKDQGKIIGRPGPRKEILDIAGLAPGVLRAAAVEDAPGPARLGQKMRKPQVFGLGDGGITGVGQDGEMDGQSGGFVHRTIHRRDTGKGHLRVFIIHRHQNHGSARRRQIGERAPRPEGFQPHQPKTSTPGQPGGREEQEYRTEQTQRGQAINGGIFDKDRGSPAADHQRQNHGSRPHQADTARRLHLCARRSGHLSGADGPQRAKEQRAQERYLRLRTGSGVGSASASARQAGDPTPAPVQHPAPTRQRRSIAGRERRQSWSWLYPLEHPDFRKFLSIARNMGRQLTHRP